MLRFFLIGFVTAALTLTGCNKNKMAITNEVMLQELNRVVATVSMQGGGKTLTTNEIAKFLELSGQTFPTPPVGPRLVLVPATRQFEFVNQ